MAIKSDFCKVEDCEKPRDKSQGSSMCIMHRVRWSRFKSHDLPIKTLPEGIVHICKIHGELTPDEAYKNDNYSSYQCYECKKNAMKKFDEKNPNRDTNILKKNWYIGKGKNKVKVTKEYYEELLQKQDGSCAICGNPETMIRADKKGIKRLAIDHCHKTKIIRGLLCQMCNQALGHMKDSIERLESAIRYLKAHQ